MKLSEQLQTRLSKIFEPSAMIEMHYNGNDIAFKTDEEGNAVLLFIGRKNEKGQIKGERYARTFKRDKDGVVFKDHWELKGKAN